MLSRRPVNMCADRAKLVSRNANAGFVTSPQCRGVEAFNDPKVSLFTTGLDRGGLNVAPVLQFIVETAPTGGTE